MFRFPREDGSFNRRKFELFRLQIPKAVVYLSAERWRLRSLENDYGRWTCHFSRITEVVVNQKKIITECLIIAHREGRTRSLQISRLKSLTLYPIELGGLIILSK